METIQQWILSVTAMSVLAALSQMLMPEGPAKQGGRLVCALLLFVVIVRPVLRGNVEDFLSSLNDYDARYSEYSAELQRTDQSLTADIIARETAAYIEDKAAQSGCRCSVSVQCEERDGVPIPSALTVSGALSQEQQNTLLELAEQELGLSRERISFTEEGGT